MSTQSDNQQQESTVQVTCPHCKKSFWAKFGHVLKEVGTAAVDIAVGSVVGNLGAFKDE